MKSPFPGMDPYLESRWSDVHLTLIAAIKAAIQPLLPPALRARAEEKLVVESTDEDPVSYYRGDVTVIDAGHSVGAAVAQIPQVTAEPIDIEFHDGPVMERFVQILDRDNGNRIVTVIEVLSPWNKGPGRLNNDYRKKIAEYGRGGVALVEIDLLRFPNRNRLPVGQKDLPANKVAPYLTVIRRPWVPGRWTVYPLKLRERLPVIPIPLRQEDREITLDLQSQIDRVYLEGGHDDINYSKPCDPPLEGEDAAWADQLLKSSGFRK